MATQFVELPAVDDANVPVDDPNATEPKDNEVLQLKQNFGTDQNPRVERTAAVRFYLNYDNPNATAAVDVTPWVFDEGNEVWIAFPTISAVGDNQLQILDDLDNEKLFLQFTNQAGTFDRVRARVARLQRP